MKAHRPCPGTISFMIAIGSLFFLTLSAAAQDHRWSVELRPGYNISTDKVGGVDLEPGVGVEAVLGYKPMEHLGFYAGWGWNQFSPDIENAGHYEETGYTFGLRFQHPINDNLDYLVAIGSIYNHIELEDNEGNIYGDTGHGFGWQAEAGVAIPFCGRWEIAPGIRYRALSRDLTVNEVNTQLDLTYISFGIGLSVHF